MIPLRPAWIFQRGNLLSKANCIFRLHPLGSVGFSMVPGAVLRVAAEAVARRHGVGRVPVPHYSRWRADLHHGTEGAGGYPYRFGPPRRFFHTTDNYRSLGREKRERRETQREVTPFGRLVLFFEFLRYREAVSQHLPFRFTPLNAIDPVETLPLSCSWWWPEHGQFVARRHRLAGLVGDLAGWPCWPKSTSCCTGGFGVETAARPRRT